MNAYIKPYYRLDVAEAISGLCLRVSGKAVKSFAIEWLIAIPVYHFLTERSQLCGKAKLNFEVDWKFYEKKFGISKICEKVKEEKQ